MRDVKKNINTSLIANGDICSKKAVALALDYTQVDGIIIGRSSFGKFWIFARLKKILFGIQHEGEINDDYKKRTALGHIEATYTRYTADQFYIANRQNHFVHKVTKLLLIGRADASFCKA